MSSAADREGPAEPASATARAARRVTDILQASLLFCVIAWAVDLPRGVLGVSFYTEQLLTVCLGLALADGVHRWQKGARLVRMDCIDYLDFDLRLSHRSLRKVDHHTRAVTD